MMAHTVTEEEARSLYNACRNNQHEVVESLIKGGVMVDTYFNVISVGSDGEKTALHVLR